MNLTGIILSQLRWWFNIKKSLLIKSQIHFRSKSIASILDVLDVIFKIKLFSFTSHFLTMTLNEGFREVKPFMSQIHSFVRDKPGLSAKFFVYNWRSYPSWSLFVTIDFNTVGGRCTYIRFIKCPQLNK